MKKITTLLLAVAGFAIAGAQEMQNNEPLIQKNLAGVQAGFLGANIYDEVRIGEKMTLRGDLSLDAGIWGGTAYSKTGFVFIPSLSVQPKYYYNIAKRAENSKNINNNAANYFSLNATYYPDWFVLSNVDGLHTNSSLNFVPTWGFRRNFGGSFNYEFNVGYGLGIRLGDWKGYGETSSTGGVFQLSFKVGYDF